MWRNSRFLSNAGGSLLGGSDSGLTPGDERPAEGSCTPGGLPGRADPAPWVPVKAQVSRSRVSSDQTCQQV